MEFKTQLYPDQVLLDRLLQRLAKYFASVIFIR